VDDDLRPGAPKPRSVDR